MTSHKKSSGFEFWSCVILRMAVMHLPTKFCAFRVIDIFWNPRWRPPPF